MSELDRCPMPQAQGRHRFTAGWRPSGPGDLGGRTCQLCHQSWIKVPGGALVRTYDFLSSPSTATLGDTPSMPEAQV